MTNSRFSQGVITNRPDLLSKIARRRKLSKKEKKIRARI